MLIDMLNINIKSINTKCQSNHHTICHNFYEKVNYQHSEQRWMHDVLWPKLPAHSKKIKAMLS